MSFFLLAWGRQAQRGHSPSHPLLHEALRDEPLHEEASGQGSSAEACQSTHDTPQRQGTLKTRRLVCVGGTWEAVQGFRQDFWGDLLLVLPLTGHELIFCSVNFDVYISKQCS